MQVKYLRTTFSFFWSAQIYLLVGGFLFWFPDDINSLFGYLASFVFTSLGACLVVLSFRSTLRPVELLLPLILFSGITYLFIKYFYMSERTEMFVLGMYSMGFTMVETGRFLYNNSSISDKLHVFPLSSHLVASTLSLGVWFFSVDFLPWQSEVTILKSILITYILIGVSIVFLQTCEKYYVISIQTLKKLFTYIFVSVFIITTISLFSSFVVFELSNTKF